MKIKIFIKNKETFEKLNNKDPLKRDYLLSKIGIHEMIKIVKKEKMDHFIYIDNYDNVNYVYKRRGSWQNLNNSQLDLYFAEKFNIIKLTDNNSKNKREIFKKIKNHLNAKSRLVVEDNAKSSFLNEQINFLLSDPLSKLKKWDETRNFLRFSSKKLKKGYAELIIGKINGGEKIPGINISKIIESSENNLVFINPKSLVEIEMDDDSCSYFFVTSSNSELDSHYYNKALESNLKNNIYDIKIKKKKIKTKDLIIASVGLIIFVILAYLTFTKIFDFNNINSSISLLFEKNSFSDPWIYLLWTNFLMSYFFSFLLTLVVTILISGRKPNFKMTWNVFIGRQIMLTTRFITGEAILGNVFMAWYLAKENNVKVSSYVGTMASLSILRIPLQIIFTTPFMITGQLYANQLFNLLPQDLSSEFESINSMVFFSLSWIGYSWSIIHHSLVPIIILIPTAHYLYSWGTTQVLMLKKDRNILNKARNREMSIESMKSSVNRIIKNKRIIIRTSLAITLVILLEALESMYIFEIVENSNNFSSTLDKLGIGKSNYFNFIQLSGIRLMISNVYQSPIINLLPGNGLFIIEYFMHYLNEIIFFSKHWDSSNIDQLKNVAADFSSQSTFLTRFFNVYLQRFLSLVICFFVLIRIFIRKINTQPNAKKIV